MISGGRSNPSVGRVFTDTAEIPSTDSDKCVRQDGFLVPEVHQPDLGLALSARRVDEFCVLDLSLEEGVHGMQ